jgi:hypothetical protein
MGPRHFDLVSHWRLHAPVDSVWAALVQPEQWPQWWPGLRAVRTLRAGQPGGLGSVRRMDWDTGLPYGLHLSVETVEVLQHQRLRGRVRGTLRGDGLWLLRGQGRRHRRDLCVARGNWARRGCAGRRCCWRRCSAGTTAG